jgi:hypothetical protein
LRVETEGFSSLSLELELGLSSGDLDVRNAAQLAALLRRVAFHYTDQGFNGRKTAYCSGQTRESEDTYTSRHLQLAQRWLEQQGLNASKLLNAYQDAIKADSWLSLTLAPIEPVNPAALMHYPLDYLVQLLRPELSVNGNPVPVPELIAIPSLKNKTPFSLAGQVQKSRATESHEPAARPRIPRKPAFHQVQTNQLDRHVGRYVKIITHDGRKHAGVMTHVEPDALLLKRRTSGGFISFRVSLSDIREIEAYW